MIAPTSQQLRILVERATRHLTADEGDMLRAGVEDLQSERLMSSDPTVTPSAGPSEGSTGHQRAANGFGGGLAVSDVERPAEARTADPWLARRRLAPYADPSLAPRALLTPSAAPVPASQRPEVAGEPESGQDGAAGREATRREPAGKDTVAVPRWEYELMAQQQERAAKAEATIERMKRTNRMVNGGARDSRERAERAEADLDALRLKVADLERIAAGPQPPEQDSTGWQWLCHRCDLGADGHFTRRGALRAQRKHLDAAHR